MTSARRKDRAKGSALHGPAPRDHPVHGLTAAVLVIIMMAGMLAGPQLAIPSITEEADASANPIPIVSIQLTPSQMQAHITDSQIGAVSFAGIVTVDKIPAIERLIVTLTAGVDTGWPVVISPMTMPFVNPGTRQFQVTVVVPPSTSSLIIGTVMVTGSAKVTGMAPIISTANGVVTVAQFFKLRLETESPLREVSPGDVTYNLVNVFNDGNSIDTIEVEIENIKELVDAEWTVLLGSTDVSVKADEYVPVKVTVQTSQEWRLWAKEIYPIILKATSMEAKERNEMYIKSYPVFVYMKGFHIPGFDPFMAIIALVIALVMFQGAQERADSRLEKGRVKEKNQSP